MRLRISKSLFHVWRLLGWSEARWICIGCEREIGPNSLHPRHRQEHWIIQHLWWPTPPRLLLNIWHGTRKNWICAPYRFWEVDSRRCHPAFIVAQFHTRCHDSVNRHVVHLDFYRWRCSCSLRLLAIPIPPGDVPEQCFLRGRLLFRLLHPPDAPPWLWPPSPLFDGYDGLTETWFPCNTWKSQTRSHRYIRLSRRGCLVLLLCYIQQTESQIWWCENRDNSNCRGKLRIDQQVARIVERSPADQSDCLIFPAIYSD